MSNVQILDSTVYTITSTSWVAPITDTTKNWILTNIGGTPIEILITDTNKVPQDTDRRQYTIGGIMNDLIVPKNKKGWVRCCTSSDTGILQVRDAALGEVDMLTELRKNLVDQSTEFIKLTQRVTATELQTHEISCRLDVHDYVVQNIQSTLADMIVDNMNRYLTINQKILDLKVGIESYLRSYYNSEIQNLNETMLSMQGVMADIIEQVMTNIPSLRLRMRRLEQKMDDLDVDPRIADLEMMMPSIQYILTSVLEHIATSIPSLKLDIIKLKNNIVELAQSPTINYVPGSSTTNINAIISTVAIAFHLLSYYNTVIYAYQDVYLRYKAEEIQYDEDVFQYRMQQVSYELIDTVGKNSSGWDTRIQQFVTTYPEMSQYRSVLDTLKIFYFSLADMFSTVPAEQLASHVRSIIDTSYVQAKNATTT